MSQVHAAVGAGVLAASVVFALVAFGTVVLHRHIRWLDGVRVALSGLAVVAAATGVALALNGARPSDAIHWLYGAVIVVVPVIAAAVDVGGSVRLRSAVLGVAGVLIALIAWRLAATG